MSVTLSPEDRLVLEDAINAEQTAIAIHQATEMRLRADVLDAQRTKQHVLRALCKTHGLDPTKAIEYTGGVLSLKAD